MGVLSAIADSVIGWLSNPSAAGSTTEQLDVTIIDIVSMLEWLTQVTEDVAESLKSAVHRSTGDARDVGAALQHIGGDLYDITRHTYGVVIPHSQEWTYGRVERNIGAPLRRRVTRLESTARFLLGWRGQVDNWRNHYVDPQLEKDRRFVQWFDGWPKQSVTVVHAWLTHSQSFADFAVPRITLPMVAYIGRPAQRAILDALTREIVDASPDVWRHVEAAAVAVLLTEQ